VEIPEILRGDGDLELEEILLQICKGRGGDGPRPLRILKKRVDRRELAATVRAWASGAPF